MQGHAVASSLKAANGSSLIRNQYARAAIAIPSIANGASASVTVPITGALTTDQVIAKPASAFLDGFAIQARVTATDTVTLRFSNKSGSSYAGATVDFDVLVSRPAA